MPAPVLKQAARLVKKRKFKDVIKLLEPQIFKFRNSFQYYYLLGVSCLYLDDIEGAESYLERACQMKEDHSNCLLGKAAVHLKKSEYEESIKIWLQILEHDKNNRIARKGLGILKKNIHLSNAEESGEKVNQLFPPVGSEVRPFPVALILFIAISLVLATPLILTSLKKPRPESEDFRFPESGKPILSAEGSYRYEFTQKEIKKIFEKAKEYFNQYRDNLCNVELNRIIYSNASQDLKQTAITIKAHIKEPNFITIRDSLALSVIRKDPYLYEGCYILWKGKLANLKTTSEMISFDFLAGYHKEQDLEGIVPVTLDFAADLSNGGNLELLGQVRLLDDTIAIKGVSIHKLL